MAPISTASLQAPALRWAFTGINPQAGLVWVMWSARSPCHGSALWWWRQGTLLEDAKCLLLLQVTSIVKYL